MEGVDVSSWCLGVVLCSSQAMYLGLTYDCRHWEASPCGAAEYHVQVHAGNLVAQVVTVEHIHPVRTRVVDTTACRAVPRVIAAALELSEDARLRRRGLLEVGVVVEDGEVWRETVGARAFGQVAGPAGWVVVNAVDVDVAAGAKGVVVFRPGLRTEVGVVVQTGDLDGRSTNRALEQLHVVDACGVGGFGGYVLPLVAVFVFDLVEDDVASVGYGVRKNDFGHLFHVRLPCGGVSRVVVAESAIVAGGKPARESSCVGFGVDVRAWTENHVETDVFSDLEQSFEVVGTSLEVQNAILR